MNAVEITSMSTKGQIIIPQIIRNELRVDSGAKFMIMTDGENILLKPIAMPKMEAFGNLIKRSKEYIKKTGMRQSELAALIKKDRNENRS